MATFLLLLMVALLAAGCAAPNFSSGNVAPSAAPMEASSADSSAEFVAQADGGVPGDASSAALNRRLIARATLDLVVQDTASALAGIEAVLEENGGFISNSTFYGDASDPSNHYGNMTLRVPAENLDAALDAIAALAVRVNTRNIDREDITDQYTDTEAQLRTLEATEEELFLMLEEVRERPDATPEDILAVHTRLMEVRGQIEQVQGRKNMFDNLVGLSTITVTLRPDSSAAPVVEEGWRPGSVLRDATRALVNGLQYLGDFLIWFVVFVLPITLLALLPFVLLFLMLRWLVRRGRKRGTVEGEK